MKLTVTVREACDMVGLKKTKVYDLIREGRLQTTVVDRRRLVKVDSLQALVA